MDQNNHTDEYMTYDDAKKVIRKLNFQIIVYCILALIFIVYGIWQWYDLYQIESGLKSGNISSIMHFVYAHAGKWGVLLFYWFISIWIGCMAYRKRKALKEVKKEIFGE